VPREKVCSPLDKNGGNMKSGRESAWKKQLTGKQALETFYFSASCGSHALPETPTPPEFFRAVT